MVLVAYRSGVLSFNDISVSGMIWTLGEMVGRRYLRHHSQVGPAELFCHWQEPIERRLTYQALAKYDARMATYIALLRAVNVGGTGKLAMADLRSMAEQAGLSDVQTYIQSGNLVFSCDDAVKAKATLEKSLKEYAGKAVHILFRTAEEMRNVLDANPFPKAEPSKVGILFLDDAPPSDTISAARGQADEEIMLGAREVYIHFPSGMGRSKLRLPVMSEGTVRNVNTIGKLVKMATDG